MKAQLRRFALLILVAAIAPACGKSSGASPGPAGGGAILRTYGANAGIVSEDPSGQSGSPSAIALDSTSMYITGVDTAGGRVEKRALSDGALVPGFGAGGVALSANFSIFAMAIDAKFMYLVGYELVDASTSNYGWHLEKRNLSDGALVTSFGTGGVISENPSPNLDIAYGIAIDSTAMYVVGVDRTSATSHWRIEKRLLSDGSFVAGFGTSGVVQEVLTANLRCISIDASFMYIVGQNWNIEKRTLSTGALVGGFGTGGLVTGVVGFPYAIAIDSTAMYVVGIDGSSSATAVVDRNWRIEKRLLSDGSLVGGFSGGGVVTVNPGAGWDAIRAIVLDATSLYVAGNDSGTGAWRLEKRDLTTGALISGFGSGGVVNSAAASPLNGAVAYGLARDQNSLYVVGNSSSCATASGGWRIEKRDLTTAALSAAFGDTGGITANDTGAMGLLNAVTQNGGILYLAGSVSGGAWHIEARAMSDGSLVVPFGTGGTVTVAPVTGPLNATAIATDGTNLYIAGHEDVSGGGDMQWRIEKRLLADGSLVAGFGTAGVIRENPSFGDDRVTSILFSGGTLYIAGFDSASGDRGWRIEARTAATGAFVGGFGTAGIVVSNPSPGSDQANALVADATNLYVVGTGNGAWRVEKRLLADGSLVGGFGATGIQGEAYAAVMDPFGFPPALLVVGSDTRLGVTYAAEMGFDLVTGATGGVTSIFNTGSYRAASASGYAGGRDADVPGSSQWLIGQLGGLVFSGIAPGQGSTIRAMVEDGANLYAVGDGFSPAGSNGEWRIEKRDLSTLALIPGFGTGGVLTINPLGSDVRVVASAVRSTSLYVFGSTLGGLWRLEKRATADGSLDASFGTGGAILSSGAAGPLTASAMAVDSSGIYLVGAEDLTGAGMDFQWRVEKRDLATGALVSGFAFSGLAGGIYTSNPSPGDDRPTAVAMDSNWLYVVGYDNYPGGSGFRWRIEKIDTNSGFLKLAVTSDPSGGDDRALGIAIDAASMYVVGFSATPSGDSQWRIEKRSLVSGAADPTFGLTGVLTEDVTPGDDRAVGVQIDQQSLYVAGFDASPGGSTYRWRLEKRSGSTGALDSTFGSGGIVTSNDWAPDNSRIVLLRDADQLYLAGGDRSPGAFDSQWHVERRSLMDGSLESGFGLGGVVTENLSQLDDLVTAMAIDSTGLYLAGVINTCEGFGTAWHLEKRSK